MKPIYAFILFLVASFIPLGELHAQTVHTDETNHLKITTPSGYVQIGPQNTSWSHFETDRPNFYFNKSIYVNGRIHSYTGNNLQIGTYGKAQLTILESNGYIGIGTSNPLSLFHLNGGDFLISSGTSTYNIVDKGIRFTTDNRPYFASISTYRGSSSTTIGLRIRTMNGTTTPVEAIHISPNGNIGIGATNPNSSFEIAHNQVGDWKNAMRIYSNNPNPHWLFYMTTNGLQNTSGFHTNNNNIHMILRGSDGLIKTSLRSTGDSYIVGGNLGIGTTSPVELLQVGSSSQRDVNIRIGERASIGLTTTHAETVIGNNAIVEGANVVAMNTLAGASAITMKWYDGIRFYTTKGSVTKGQIINTDLFEKFSITPDNGVFAEEVTVNLQSSWPDFVFEPDYDLPTLAETEAYIKANKHLPEIPSAAEMQTNGLELGKMNMLLLQKIEEMTLILIEQNKRIIELENKE